MQRKLTTSLLALAVLVLLAGAAHGAATTICWAGSITAQHGDCPPSQLNYSGYTLDDCLASRTGIINAANNAGYTILAYGSCQPTGNPGCGMLAEPAPREKAAADDE